MFWEYKYFRGGKEEKLNILKKALENENRVLLAIVFGSFVELESYRDIDVAIYTTDTSLDYLIELSIKLEERVGVPVDVVPLVELDPKFKWKILTKGVVIVEKVPGLYEALLNLVQDEMMLSKLW
ncbi:nucleotidyltransferase domain-containing protein [Ignisphaera sp. 4213-co]|uniref:Nucleotidyltransferase domain-containing protein n=1 Tax=Ignisphaera cupida TaxID=3050454 RepID=A0ABD4Z4L9_9CREN|nr:nucleotidyltransferase domain-containing protein [Ignisphaera sp. 4213-co]MDK6027917.1 nucleotidyltransferase domain-containing protein [Ignisphaera sp. 4213-co]